MAKALRIRISYAAGHLTVFWHVVMEQAEDGDITSWSDEFIAAAADFPGDAPQFVQLLKHLRWLDATPDGKVLVHDWLDYAGRYLSKKYQNNAARWSQIQAKHREGSLKVPRGGTQGDIDLIRSARSPRGGERAREPGPVGLEKPTNAPPLKAKGKKGDGCMFAREALGVIESLKADIKKIKEKHGNHEGRVADPKASADIKWMHERIKEIKKEQGLAPP